MKRGLVGAEVHVNILICESFPKVDHIAFVCERYDLLSFRCLAYARDELVEVGMDFVHPALLISLACCERIDLCNNAYNSGNHAGLRLRSRHSSKSGGYEQHTFHVLFRTRQSFGCQLLACGVHYGDGRAVYYALRAYVHI